MPTSCSGSKPALSKPILLVTIAPELPGSEAFIRAMSEAGKIVAIGHSAANAETVAMAVRAGARMSTHLGNGLPQILPKLDNTLFAQLAERDLSASFIVDGIHLPQPALRAMIRAKGTRALDPRHRCGFGRSDEARASMILPA